MELDNIKSNWKKMGDGKKDQNELSVMTSVKNHPNIKKIKIKLIIETILIIVFLAVYYDVFDGATKPLWVNILLIVASIPYIIVRIVGWFVLRNPVKGDNLKKSLINFQDKLKQMAISVLVTSFLFGSSIIWFFASSIDFTTAKYLMLGGMVLSLIVFVYLSSRNWFKRVEGINSTLSDFNSTDL
jgi:hypothetical protein